MIPSFDFWKCSLILFGFCHLASSASFRCYRTFTDYVQVEVKDAENLLNASNSAFINVSLPTYLIVLGYTFEMDGPVVNTLVPTMLNQGNRNVVVLNWEKEAGEGGEGPVLGYELNALPNCKKIGEEVGDKLAYLVLRGLNREIHIVSHSLGAQNAGYIGRQARIRGLSITRLYALDPARLGFGSLSLYKKVDKSCADLVTVVHCDAGGYALNISLGHVDFWPNFQNYASKSSVRMQPGCVKGESALEKYVGGNSCSHTRCWQYYNVSINSPTLFEGGKADNYYDWLSKDGQFETTNYIGPQVNPEKPGDFYLVTSSDYPWGLGSGGLVLQQSRK